MRLEYFDYFSGYLDLRIYFQICTGCGKTSFLLNLIYDLLPWSKLYVCAKDLEEEKYVGLKSACQPVKLIDKAFDYIFDTVTLRMLMLQIKMNIESNCL